MLRFDPFILFRVLRHHAPIRSLPFVSSSQALCPDSIPFYFEFSGIVPGFDPTFCFGFSGIMPGFDPYFLFWVLRHRARIRSLLFVSGCPASCLDSIPSFCFRFSDIMPGFHFLFQHRVWISHLPRHCAWVSLSPSVVATQFR